MKEIWKDITGYEGIYQVSNFGRIRSLDREIKNKTIFGSSCRYFAKGKILKARFSKNKKIGYVNYPRVVLRKNNLPKQFCVHKLVAQAFIPNPQKKPQVDHIDSNPLNNCVSNLKWCTQKENNNNPISRKRRSSIFYNGTLAKEIALRNGISKTAFYLRLRYGWSLKNAITKPMINKLKKKKGK